jgi:probable metal-binding protein
MRFGFRRVLFCRDKVRHAIIAAGLHSCWQRRISLHSPTLPMTDAIAIHGHDIIDLVSTHPDGIRLSQLMEIVSERFGRMVTFHTCSAAGMDLDELLHFLEARDKVRITGGVVYPGGAPGCEH